MLILHKIESYSIQILSNYAGGGGYQMGFVHLYDDDIKYLGYLGIIKDGHELPQNRKDNNGIMNIYFHESELQAILDTLRNEDPVFIQFNLNSKWGSIVTDKVPANKGEFAA